jgi:hypothetical protein
MYRPSLSLGVPDDGYSGDLASQPEVSRSTTLGVEQYHNGSIAAMTKLPVLLSSICYMLVFAWIIGLNAAINVFIRDTMVLTMLI